MTDEEAARAALEATAALHREVAATRAAEIVRAAALIVERLRQGGQVLAFGNGGSASDAQHFALDLVGRFRPGRDRRALAALALAADAGVVTSVANDFGFEQVFARQIEALGRPGDVALGITTSGASVNVNAGLARARGLGLATIALTGRDGGRSAALADVHVNVPDEDTPRVQDVHRTILHVWCELVESSVIRDAH
jgi:D-sedoheptulose 7-phosphate isomerase